MGRAMGGDWLHSKQATNYIPLLLLLLLLAMTKSGIMGRYQSLGGCLLALADCPTSAAHSHWCGSFWLLCPGLTTGDPTHGAAQLACTAPLFTGLHLAPRAHALWILARCRPACSRKMSGTGYLRWVAFTTHAARAGLFMLQTQAPPSLVSFQKSRASDLSRQRWPDGPA